MKKTSAFIITVTAVITLLLPCLAAGSSGPGIANAHAFGDYTVYVYKDARWIEAGRLGFNQYL